MRLKVCGIEKSDKYLITFLLRLIHTIFDIVTCYVIIDWWERAIDTYLPTYLLSFIFYTYNFILTSLYNSTINLLTLKYINISSHLKPIITMQTSISKGFIVNFCFLFFCLPPTLLKTWIIYSIKWYIQSCTYP